MSFWYVDISVPHLFEILSVCYLSLYLMSSGEDVDVASLAQ